jgi:hypothetical protein
MDTGPHHDEQERLAAAAEIQHRITELTRKMGVTVSTMVWNLDQGMNHSGPHRLDICIAGKVTKIYFTDNELVAFPGKQPAFGTQARLERIVRQCQDARLYAH